MKPRSYSERDIHLALDGELPPDDLTGYEKWLAAHPDMRALADRFADDRDVLRQALEPLMAEPVPERLSRLAGSPAGESVYRSSRMIQYAAAGVVLLMLGGIAGYLAAPRLAPSSPTLAQFADNAMRAHQIYSNEKLHVVEVAADQRDHLQSWLSNRVGVKLVAPDLSNQGFELIGGRLLPSADRTAAQFMYQDPTGNRVSLYVTRDETGADTGYRETQQNGARTIYWLDNGYGSAVTGAVPERTLAAIADTFYRQLLDEKG